MHDLAQRFTDFAKSFEKGAPLYSRIAARVAEEPAVLELMSVAPIAQRIPVLLFASAHYLLLDDRYHELAQHYPNITSTPPTGDAANLFVAFVLQRADAMKELLANRTTQTNEISRCNWFLFPSAMLDAEVGPLAQVDVGSSAGLNQLFPNLGFDLNPGGLIGKSAALTITCDITGTPPVPTDRPHVIWSMGLDTKPIDVRNDAGVRWLEACVWPDQVERFNRLQRAIALARHHNIVVERGDAVDDVAQAIERAAKHAHPVVTTSWVLNYLPPERRIAFVDELDRVGSERDLSWVIAESPYETPELPGHRGSDELITVITLVTWRQGQRSVQRLATTHPHGQWIHWGN
ncbi:MAG: DUF2332 domain-containing protein [Actinomycetota bacterium]|nr:DUF2332 domain-containing protein [Actinomycetota bacterium]